MSEATWRDLSYLESRDLAGALFREVHGRAPNEARSHSIVAAFAQGRRYFEAAEAADYLVRPPLLLYGVIALSRGLTLFLDSTRGEEALSPTHGVHADGWAETLGPTTVSAEPLRHVAELRASFARGTFTDLLAATRNIERAPVMVQPADESLESSSAGTQDVDRLTVTFGDVMSRLPDLAVSYARTFGSRGRCYPARVTYQKPQQETRVEILPTTFLGLPSDDEVRAAFTLPPWLPVTEQPFQSVLQPGRVAVTFVIPHPAENDLEAIPCIVQTADQRGFVLAHKPGEVRFSVLLTLYLLAFFTGTLARYHASVWLTLQTPGKGDFLAPIVREAVAAVLVRYPELIMREIRYATPSSL